MDRAAMPLCSPIWSTRERATVFESPESVAEEIKSRYGYPLVIGSNVNEEKQSILADMKAGRISKSDGATRLRTLAAA